MNEDLKFVFDIGLSVGPEIRLYVAVQCFASIES